MANEVVEAQEVTRLVPAMNMTEAVSAFDEYQELQNKLARDGDFVTFKTRDGVKPCPTKQWRVKLERFFGLSVEITKDWDTTEEDKSVTYHKRVRVTHTKSGLFHEATGSCNTKEKERDYAKKYHNAEAHAETRAKNRAVFEFVGFGEVSLEEMQGGNGNHERDITPPKPRPQQQRQVNAKQTPNTPPNAPMTPAQDKMIQKMLKSKYLSEDERKGYTEDYKTGMSKERATKLIGWWLGDSKKGLKGERDKREKANKYSERQKEIIGIVKEGGIKDRNKLLELLREKKIISDKATYEELMTLIDTDNDKYDQIKAFLGSWMLGNLPDTPPF
jgi:uncharacterized protein YhfF